MTKLPLGLSDPEPSWEPVAGIADITGHPPKFVSAGQEQNRLLIRFFRDKSDGSLKGRVWFGPLCEGPPGTAHGGSVAAVLDEAMGQAGWLAGYPVVAAKIEVNFRKMLPLEQVVTVDARVLRVEGRKIFIEGRLIGSDGTVYADSNGLFVLLDPARHAQVFQDGKRPLT